MSRSLLLCMTGMAIGVSACATVAAPAPAPTPAAPAGTDTIPAGIDPFAPELSALLRVDEQGAIVVEVTPKNLDAVVDNVEFEVALNTHSIDLSMDLAVLSTLTTDNGLSVAAEVWEAPRGGHHTAGTLVFRLTAEEVAVLETASRLTLTMIDLDVPIREFVWELR